MFRCELCTKEFKSKSNYEKHQCVWYCEQCCIAFHFKHVYKRHLTTLKHKKAADTIDTNEQSGASINITNNTNTTHITNNITHNTTNNIVIFGNEDFSYINKSDIQEALKTKNVLPKLCRLMRRNPDHPENRNIKVTDFSRGKTRIFGQYGWEPVQPIDAFNNLISEASGMLDHKTCTEKYDYTQPDLEKVDEITDKVHELDMAQWQGKDTKWGQENRRAIMLEFVE